MKNPENHKADPRIKEFKKDPLNALINESGKFVKEEDKQKFETVINLGKILTVKDAPYHVMLENILPEDTKSQFQTYISIYKQVYNVTAEIKNKKDELQK